jgi:hypothetical protein
LTIGAVGAAIIASTAVPASAAGTRVVEPQYGFAFRLPAKWVQVPLDGSDISGLLAIATKADPSLENALSAEVKQAAEKGIKFFAVGPVVGTQTPNMNIFVGSAGGAPAGNAFFKVAAAQVKISLAQAGMKNLKTSVVKFQSGKALQVTYSISANPPVSAMYGDQIYVVHKSNLDVITFTSTSTASAQRVASVVEKSWSWK